MKTIVEELCENGLSEIEARKAMQIVFDWVDEKYPVMGALARNTVMKEIEPDAEDPLTE